MSTYLTRYGRRAPPAPREFVAFLFEGELNKYAIAYQILLGILDCTDHNPGARNEITPTMRIWNRTDRRKGIRRSP